MSKLCISNIIQSFQQSNIVDLSKCAIIYARCSTLQQNQDMNQSLQTQIGICQDYATTHNLTISNIISEVVPGHNSKKQSYNSVLKYHNTNVIIADTSRLSRNIGDGNIFIKKC